MNPENYSNRNENISDNSGNLSSYEKGLESAQAGQYEKALSFMQEHLQTAD